MTPTPGNIRLGTSLTIGLALELGRMGGQGEFEEMATATPDTLSVNGGEWIKCIVGQEM
jgi:hypothetical protein